MFKFYVSTLIHLFAVYASTGSSDPTYNYCKHKCLSQPPEKQIHTICSLGHNCEESSECKNYKNQPLSKQEKQEIIDIHNEWRNRLAWGKENCWGMKEFPSATNMREIVWDKELEFQAQCWGNQCKYTHDTCRITSYGWKSGQNLQIATNWENIRKPLQSWYRECNDTLMKHIKQYDINKNPNHPNGHFTQFIWAETSRIGCARTGFYYNKWSRNATLFICNYAISGNLLGANVYISGKPCSNCAKPCRPTYKGLCATKPSTAKVPNICQYAKDKKKCIPYLGIKEDAGPESPRGGSRKVKTAFFRLGSILYMLWFCIEVIFNK